MTAKYHKSHHPVVPPTLFGRFGQRLGLFRRWYRLSIMGLIAFSLALVVTAAVVWQSPLSTPLSERTSFRFLKTSLLPFSQGKEVYGFIPYWNMSTATIHPELTRAAYFSLTIGADGSILSTADGGVDPGFATLKGERFLELSEELRQNTIPLDIVLSQFAGADIVTFLNTPEAHQTLLTELDSVLLAYPFAGVNLDIEYSGTVSAQLRDNMTAFTKTLSDHLEETYSDPYFSIDVYASAASNNQLWDIPALEPHVDAFFVMAYDFHRRSSTQAGPVAPLFGGATLWSSDISSNIRRFLTTVPAEKIILGTPFYGYEWETTEREPQALTLPNSGATATFAHVQELLQRKDELAIQEHWHETALTPYLTYVENGVTHVVYYEDARSLSYKLDFVNQLDLGGVGIWALGYEGDDTTLWRVIGDKL